MTTTHRTLAALVWAVCLLFPAWAESAHPTPADPNHVHGHTDSGVGSGGLDNGVAKPVQPGEPEAIAVFTPPAVTTVLPAGKVPPAAAMRPIAAWRWTIKAANSHEHALADLVAADRTARVVVVLLVEPRDGAPAGGIAGSLRLDDQPAERYAGLQPGSALVVPVPAAGVAKVRFDSDGTAAGYGPIGCRMFLWP